MARRRDCFQFAWRCAAGGKQMACLRLIEAQREFLIAPTWIEPGCGIDAELFGTQKEDADTDQGNDDATGANDEQEPAPLRSTAPCDHGHEEIDDGENDIAQWHGDRKGGLQENAGVVSDDGIDAGGGVAGEDDESQHEGITYLRCKSDSARACLGKLLLARCTVSSISRNSRPACSAERERSKAA